MTVRVSARESERRSSLVAMRAAAASTSGMS